MQFADIDDASLRPGMFLGNNESKLVVADTVVAQAGRVAGEKAEPDVHPALFDGGFNLGRGDFFNGQADTGMSGRKHPKQRRNQGHIEDRHNPDMESTPHLPGFDAQFLEEIFDLVQNGTSVLAEDVAGGSEQDTPAAALEKVNAQSRLEVAHLLGDVGLGEAKSIGRAAEAARFCHGEKVTQVSDFKGIGIISLRLPQ